MARVMSTFSSGGLTPRMMVLGLVVQQPDTVAGVARRLADQFASARFPKSSAHNNLPSLEQNGYVRLIADGEEPSLHRYEATAQGLARFREWLRESSISPPVLRDAVHAKLELCEQEDLPGLIRVLEDEEKACRSLYAGAHARLISRRQHRSRPPRTPESWGEKLDGILITDEATMWGMRTKRLQRLREELEDLRDEIAPPGVGVGDG
jgi:DNA-binding PadR family transcriptional regulator